MAININRLNGGNIVIGSGGSSVPTAPNGKVLYKTSLDGEWLESNAFIDKIDSSSGFYFGGFNEKNNAVTVIIPSKDTDGNDVIGIRDHVFSNCSELTSVTIPNSVMNIGYFAFESCGLTSITIPNSVREIEIYAFVGCSGLISVTIPDSVTNIGNSAFNLCQSLTSVTIVANGGNAENVKQMIITAIDDTIISDNITWNMPS